MLLCYVVYTHSGFSNVCLSAAFWPTALKLGCITNFEILSLVMGLISLDNEIQFMLISSRHISNRSMARTSLTNECNITIELQLTSGKGVMPS